MKCSIFLVVVALAAQFPSGYSGVVTWTKQGIQYLSNEQFAALQDPYGQGQAQAGQPGQQGQHGLWRDDPNAQQAPQGQADEAPPPVYDDDDDENKSEAEEEDDEVETGKEDADDESEEKDPEVADDDVEAVPESAEETKEVKYKVAKKPKILAKSKKASKRPVKEEVVEKSDEVADDEDDAADDEQEKQPPQPPMPPVLKQEMSMSQYDAAVNGVNDPNAPLLSRMTSYLTSLLGRGGIGSDPIYMNRNAKSLEEGSEVRKVVSRRRREAPVLTRVKRQMHLKDVELRPFYHVSRNIRTMVRRQPSSKLSPRLPVVDDSLSEKASKPIKLFMEPYSAAPQTYSNPPINPASGVRGPSSGVSSPGGASSGLGGSPSGIGQGAQQATNSGGGNKQGGGNKKASNNKQNSNKGNKGNSEKDSEEDSDENDSNEHDQPNYDGEDEDINNLIPSGEEDEVYQSGEADDVEDYEDDNDDNDDDEYEDY